MCLFLIQVFRPAPTGATSLLTRKCVIKTIYHQLRGLYIAGDVSGALNIVRALREWRHVFFVNRRGRFDKKMYERVIAESVSVRLRSLVTEADLVPDLRAVFYHCVGLDAWPVRIFETPTGATWCDTLCLDPHTRSLRGSLQAIQFLAGTRNIDDNLQQHLYNAEYPGDRFGGIQPPSRYPPSN